MISPRSAKAADRATIPRFDLYGEAPGDVERAFLHVETIPQRSRLHDWTIRPHAHPQHHQILFLTGGSVEVRVDEERRALAAPVLVTVSAATVHGFAFSVGADGHVLTISDAYLREATSDDPLLSTPFSGPGDIVAGEVDPSVTDAFACLEREFVRSAPGRRTAIKLNLQRILLALARARGGDAAGPASRAAATVARFRELLEREFRRQPPLPALARALGTTPSRLNAACRSVTGRSALNLLHDRVAIEAKRNLLYTGMSVAEVARSVGFADPAYFNRFFSRRTGTAPGASAPQRGRRTGTSCSVDPTICLQPRPWRDQPPSWPGLARPSTPGRTLDPARSRPQAGRGWPDQVRPRRQGERTAAARPRNDKAWRPENR